ALCNTIGAPQLASDPRFTTNENRVAHRGELKILLEEALRGRPAEEWIAMFTEQNIPAGRVNTVAQAIQLTKSLGQEPVAHTGAVRSIANPIDLNLTPATYHLPPPLLGEHDGATWH